MTNKPNDWRKTYAENTQSNNRVRRVPTTDISDWPSESSTPRPQDRKGSLWSLVRSSGAALARVVIRAGILGILYTVYGAMIALSAFAVLAVAYIITSPLWS